MNPSTHESSPPSLHTIPQCFNTLSELEESTVSVEREIPFASGALQTLGNTWKCFAEAVLR
jgi:hypothetical protein